MTAPWLKAGLCTRPSGCRYRISMAEACQPAATRHGSSHLTALFCRWAVGSSTILGAQLPLGRQDWAPIFPRRALYRGVGMPAVADINCAGAFPTALCVSLPSRVQGRGPPPVTVDLPRVHLGGVSRVRRRPGSDDVADDAHRWPYAMFADVVSK